MGYHYGPRTLQTSSSTKLDSNAQLYIVLMDVPADYQTPDETLAPRVSEADGVKTMSIDYSAVPPEILDGPFKTCLMNAYVHNGSIDNVEVDVPIPAGYKKVRSSTIINRNHSKQSEPRSGRMNAAAGSGAGNQDFKCRVHNIMNNSNGRLDFFTVATDLPAGYSSKMEIGAVSGDGTATISLTQQEGTSAQTAYLVSPKILGGVAISRVHILGHEDLITEVTGEFDGSWAL